MKSHAFVREKIAVVMKWTGATDGPVALPKLSNYVYFMFVPTLVYRDNYPRYRACRFYRKKISIFKPQLHLNFYDFLIFSSHFFPKFFEKKWKIFWSEWENSHAKTGWIVKKHFQKHCEKLNYQSHIQEWRGVFLVGFTGNLGTLSLFGGSLLAESLLHHE